MKPMRQQRHGRLKQISMKIRRDFDFYVFIRNLVDIRLPSLGSKSTDKYSPLLTFVRVSLITLDHSYIIDFFFLASEFYRSRSTRDDVRHHHHHHHHSTTSRQAPSYHHSHSTSSASARTSKMQSHILRRLASMRSTGTTTTLSTGNTASGSSAGTSGGATSTIIDRILFDQMLDLSSIPIDLSTGMFCSLMYYCRIVGLLFAVLESDDPERLRLVIQETLSRLTGESTLNDNTVKQIIFSMHCSILVFFLEFIEFNFSTKKCLDTEYQQW